MMQMYYKWHSCSCYVQGITHIRLGLPCQDYAKTSTKNEVKIIALSDGCGSSEVSQIGSELTVDFIVDFLSKNFNKLFSIPEDQAKKSILAQLIKCYKGYLSEHPDFVKDYVDMHPDSSLAQNVLKQYENQEQAMQMLGYQLLDSTLLFVAVKGDKRITGHIGDGFILGVKNGHLALLHEERKNPNYPENATVYPFDIYAELASMEDFYLSKGADADQYPLFILSSDGPDAVIKKPDPNDESTFGKKYVNKEFVELLADFALEDDSDEQLKEKIESLKEGKEKGFILSSNLDDCSIAILRRGDLDILWSDPTRIGNSKEKLEPKVYYPNSMLDFIADDNDRKARVDAFIKFYAQEKPDVVLTAAKIMKEPVSYDLYPGVHSDLLRQTKNAMAEFDLTLDSKGGRNDA